jgi:hypothetical protein
MAIIARTPTASKPLNFRMVSSLNKYRAAETHVLERWEEAALLLLSFREGWALADEGMKGRQLARWV